MIADAMASGTGLKVCQSHAMIRFDRRETKIFAFPLRLFSFNLPQKSSPTRVLRIYAMHKFAVRTAYRKKV